MGYRVTESEMTALFQALKQKYTIFGPKIQQNGGRFSDDAIVGYGLLESMSDLAITEKSYFSPKEVVFPIRQTLFYFTPEGISEPESEQQPILLFLRSCDIEGIKRLDTIFLNNGPERDIYYERLREKVKFVLMECTQGFDNCFCVSMGSQNSEEYALGFKSVGSEFLFDVKDQGFEAYFEGAALSDYVPVGVTENKITLRIPEIRREDTMIFDHPLWQEYTRRCIACGRCNTSCITCSCFTMQDVAYGEGRLGERRRRWAGCHVDGFSDMAGGHSFRRKNGERMRFKTLHKISDFKRRFGFHMCVGCGRCTDVCPEHISFSTAIEKINTALQEVSKP